MAASDLGHPVPVSVPVHVPVHVHVHVHVPAPAPVTVPVPGPGPMAGPMTVPVDLLRLDPDLADPPPQLYDVAKLILSESLPDFDADGECLYVHLLFFPPFST